MSNMMQVVKANDIINAAFKLDPNEFRLLHAMIAQVNSLESLSSEDVFELKVSDFRDLVDQGMKERNIYYAMKNSVEKLFNRYIRIKVNQTDYIKIRWVHSAGYFPSEGAVKIQFADSIIQYIASLKSNFTKYQLQQIMKFKSEYSYRFYEFFREKIGLEHNGNKRIMNVDEIREKLELFDKYEKVASLRKWVIDPAIKEINDHSDIKVTRINQIKRGRQIEAYEFLFKQNEHYEPEQPIAQGDGSPIIQKNQLTKESAEAGIKKTKDILKGIKFGS